VAYFAALLARTDDGWDASDIDLDAVDDLAGLADLMREVANDNDTVLLFIEQEDIWFAVVRVDAEDEDPRVFVSDAAAVSRSAYGDVLLSEEDSGFGEDEESLAPVGPSGDTDLLSDLGVGPAMLLKLCREDLLPADALAEIAERVGCAEELEAVR
jgi:putative tRNA adenosine deaminase-associated protein